MISLNELKDKTIGKIGTITRDLYEEKLKKDIEKLKNLKVKKDE
jgi:hypothetical protein